MKQAERWYVIYYRYLKNSQGPLEVIYFEKLVTDLETAMRKIIDYLSVDIQNFDKVCLFTRNMSNTIDCRYEHKNSFAGKTFYSNLKNSPSDE